MSLTKNEIKFVKSLQIKKFRDYNQLFIVEGEKLIEELLNQNRFEIHTLYFTSSYSTHSIPNQINSIEISEKELTRISALKSPNKVIASVKMNKNIEINFNENNLILALDNVKDPGNLGTIIRTANWFGITQIIASENTVELYNPKTIQASMGAIYHINLTYQTLKPVIEKLKIDRQIIGASLTGSSIYKTDIEKKSVLVMGSESHGISDEISPLLTQPLLIPKYGETESLNVSIATAIFLAEYKRLH